MAYDGSMPLDPASILADLATTGRTLAFCDETDITHNATGTIRARIHLLGALVMPSEQYGGMRDTLDEWRATHGLPEVHANEVVTPGTKSAWRTIDRAIRERTFALACDLAARVGHSIAYVHIPKSQYDDMRDGPCGKGLPGSHKAGVKRVFARSILDRLAGSGPAVLVMDRDKPGKAPTLTSMAGGNFLIGGGAVRADSASVAGLQVADTALYAIGRYLRRRDGIVAGQADAFDEIAMTMLAAMTGRIASLLSEAGEHG